MCEPASGHYLDNINPATGQILSLIPDSDARDVARAADAAKAAFPAWRDLPGAERAAMLEKLASLIEARCRISFT